VEWRAGTPVAHAIAVRPKPSVWFPFVACAFFAMNVCAAAAQHVPIHGLTGSIALQGNVDKIYDGVETVVVKAIDGTEHVLHVTKDTKVHGSAALATLQRGTPVVVHYTVKGGSQSTDEIDAIGPDGLKSTEGTVMGIDRVRKTITVKYAGGSVETLRLTHHAATEGETPTVKGNRVVVYYADESGQKVAHYFKRKS
jgi:hypothetical protein